MSYLDSLRKLAKQFRLSGDKDLCEKILIVIAGESGLESTRADLTYSSVMRDLNNGDKKRRLNFMKKFKETFDEAFDDGLENPEEIALLAAIKEIGYNDE